MANSPAKPRARVKLSASVMCANLVNLAADMEALQRKGFDYLHYDLMDGHFVPEIGLGISLLEQITRTQNLPVDVHLMVTDPGRFVDPLVDAGAALISIHVESGGDTRSLLRRIRNRGALAGLALRPETEVSTVQPLLDALDVVLLMAYPPGRRHQKPVAHFEHRIREMRELLRAQGRSDVDIAVDGGVSHDHLLPYRESGASFFVLGSSGLFVRNTRLSEQIDRIWEILGDVRSA